MPATWPKERRVIGTKVQRLDGPDKATGRAKYSFDINRPGMLHARILRCPYAHARLKSIDTTAAEKMPGVKAVHRRRQDRQGVVLRRRRGRRPRRRHRGTHARRLARHQGRIRSPCLPGEGGRRAQGPCQEDRSRRRQEQPERPATRTPKATSRKRSPEADAVVEGDYGVPIICHQCLETHGLVAEWDQDGSLTVGAPRRRSPAPPRTSQVTSKFRRPRSSASRITWAAASAASSAPTSRASSPPNWPRRPAPGQADARPRRGGHDRRQSAFGLRQGEDCRQQGRHDHRLSRSTPTARRASAAATTVGPVCPTSTHDPQHEGKHTVVRLNAGQQRGHARPRPSAELLADRLRRRRPGRQARPRSACRCGSRTCPPTTRSRPRATRVRSSPAQHHLQRRRSRSRPKLSDWKQEMAPAGQGPGNGPLKHGIGMALHTWGGAGGPN